MAKKEEKRPVKGRKFIFSCVVVFAFAIGWFGNSFYIQESKGKSIQIRENSPKYQFINPLILSDSANGPSESLNGLKNKISKYINEAESNGSAEDVSVYYREMNSGLWTGVNEDDVYNPSSMFKVAVMMGYLNAAEDDPSVLSKELPYTASVDPGQYYKPVHPLQSGTYTVRDLIQAMITDSDNIALNDLYNNNRDYYIDTLKTLQIPPPATASTTDFISPKIYGRIFRALYNGTFISKELSEKSLELLAYTSFKDGLVKGVPEGTIVAHKFGEHTTISGNTIAFRELHDCGIIYNPRDPYFLCVMSKGKDFPTLSKIISDISKIVYDNVKDTK